jgi:hypothetical protein
MSIQIRLTTAKRYTFRGRRFVHGKIYSVEPAVAKYLLAQRNEQDSPYFIRPDYQARIEALQKESEEIDSNPVPVAESDMSDMHAPIEDESVEEISSEGLEIEVDEDLIEFGDDTVEEESQVVDDGGGPKGSVEV